VQVSCSVSAVIDKEGFDLQGHANVMVVATTNLTKKVDAALLDRADIKAFVGLPSRHARYEILRTCLQARLRLPYPVFAIV
jgi:SpoVK/Ycf46/Vps4 family AAA+-type ATPase